MANNTATLFTAVAIAATAFLSSCQKELKENPSAAAKTLTLKEFYERNTVPLQTFSFDAAGGGSFTATSGTVVTIPASAFVDENGNAVTGNVKIELREIYKKSDMLLSNMPTTSYQWPLKSGGEFFIRATNANGALLLRQGKNIKIQQPTGITGGADAGMKAFIVNANADTAINNNWTPTTDTTTNPQAVVFTDANNYIFSLYQFSTPAANGTWCNSDNSDYFKQYTLTDLAINCNDAGFTQVDVYLVFKTVNCMVHVYESMPKTYAYNYAPLGLQCTIVAIKGNTLYSSFTPITIKNNQSVGFSLSATTTEEFKTALGNL